MENLNEQDKEKILSSIKTLLKVWHNLASKLLTTFVVLGVVAIASSLFVTTFASEIDVLVIKICSFITTLILTILSSFNLSRKGNGVRNGWRHLNAAYLKYEANLISINDLIKAYEEGEIMLGSIDFNYDTTELKEIIKKPR